jgi:hypothetical protein
MKIWYCPNCGYEVTARGRCHACKERLVASALPQLESGDEDDEVGYRLGDWADRQRGRLIERLNDLEILHRFEDDELVVSPEDEARVDDLVADVSAAGVDDEFDGVRDGDGDGAAAAPPDAATLAALRLLAGAAHRLRRDPTDMHADSDVAEASTAVFMTDVFYGADAETWAAVGRVTRRLLSALGSDEALEEEIASQAGVLDKLLTPLLDGLDSGETPTLAGGPPDGPDETGAPVEDQADNEEDDQPDDEEPEDGEEEEPAETVYELPEWLPEQRAELGVLLEDSGISYEWDGDDLVVPAERESEVEALFGRVGSVSEEEEEDADGEERYHVIEEVFAASGRLAADPDNEQRMADVMEWVGQVQGPPPIGMDEVYWFRITSHARALAEAIEGEGDEDVISAEATALHELLRTVV